MISIEERKDLVFFPTWMAGRKGYAERIRQVFEDYLKRKEMFFTSQRRQILDLLLEAERHLSQEEIYQALKPKGIGRVTVFRALKTLEDCGLIERVSDKDGKAYYEMKLERPHHDHLICVGCGSISEVRWPDLERIQNKACKNLGFVVEFHRHEVFGRCAECAKK